MEYIYADRISTVQPSAIREILKTTQDPNVISFAAGSPATAAYPLREIADITSAILQEQPLAALNYSISEGYTPLREACKKFVRDREGDIVRDDDDLIVVSGAQQGIEIVAKCFVNDGDSVVIEEPTFLSAINTFKTYNARMLGAPVKPDGVDVEVLEQLFKQNPNCRVFYTIPNFQNPTGYTMSAVKRKQVYDICVRYNVLILEDNPYGEVRFNGEHIPTIKSLDTTGHVIYVGSFSKIIAPGMRVGYILANKRAMPPMVVAKQVADVHSNILAQMVCERFLTTADMGAHLANLRGIYSQKAKLMLNALDANCGSKVAFSRPDGGMFLWATLPQGQNAKDFCTAAAARGVACVPGNPFYLDMEAECREFRLNFSAPTDEQILRGCELLGETIKSM